MLTLKTDKKNMNFAGGECSMNSTPIIIITTDTEKLGNITSSNLTAASLFGYSKTELLGNCVIFVLFDF